MMIVFEMLSKIVSIFLFRWHGVNRCCNFYKQLASLLSDKLSQSNNLLKLFFTTA